MQSRGGVLARQLAIISWVETKEVLFSIIEGYGNCFFLARCKGLRCKNRGQVIYLPRFYNSSEREGERSYAPPDSGGNEWPMLSAPMLPSVLKLVPPACKHDQPKKAMAPVSACSSKSGYLWRVLARTRARSGLVPLRHGAQTARMTKMSLR